jgi:predicted lipoprotein with Yx(FWY)xxD motif
MSFIWNHGGRRPGVGRRASVAGGTVILAAGALLLAACGGGSSSHTSTATQPPGTQSSAAAPTTSSSAAASTSTGPTVMMVSNSKYGPILVDGKGLSLYTSTLDTATKSACTGDCLKFWPPLLLPAGQTQPIAGPGITGLGTLTRAEGIQVTYNGKPLYTWVNDTKEGQVTGQGVVDSGGTWHVATLSGGTSPTPAAPTTAPTSPPTTAAPSSGGASF